MGFKKEEIPRVKAEIARILTGREFKYQKIGYLADFAEFYLPLTEKKSILEYKTELEKLGITEELVKMLILSKPFQEKYDAGVQAGMERGVEQGIEKGIEKAHFNDALKMHDKGLEWKLIQEITGLSRQKFQSLKKKYS